MVDNQSRHLSPLQICSHFEIALISVMNKLRSLTSYSDFIAFFGIHPVPFNMGGANPKNIFVSLTRPCFSGMGRSVEKFFFFSF